MPDRLTSMCVDVATVVLHTGVASLERDEPAYEEYFDVSHETAAAVQRTRAPHRLLRLTDLVITPARGARTVDARLTGFHEPRATHPALLQAMAGRPHLERVYRVALDAGYLWHEFGDLHLILPD